MMMTGANLADLRVLFRIGAVMSVMLLSTAAFGQAELQAASASAPEQKIQTEVLVSPKIKPGGSAIRYPLDEIEQFGEGWVNVGLMVDPNGKPFEVTMISSSGDRVFENAAIKGVEASTFSPGLLNGQPIESSTEYKVIFRVNSQSAGASAAFAHAYTVLTKAIAAKDRPAADAAMKRLAVKNLYEDAYFGLATYFYASAWGDDAQQLVGLGRAIAAEKTAAYLPKREFQAALVKYLALQIKLRHYAEAEDAWSDLEKAATDAATVDKIRPIVDQLNQIQSQGKPYDVPGSMPDGTWKLRLFERQFRINVSEGYKVDDKYGDCAMQLDGDRGTQFTLTQF